MAEEPFDTMLRMIRERRQKPIAMLGVMVAYIEREGDRAEQYVAKRVSHEVVAACKVADDGNVPLEH